jgi:hypothetical protein
MDTTILSPAWITAIAALIIALTGLIAELRRGKNTPPKGDQKP